MLVVITDKCNLRCPHCMQRACPENHNMMSKEVFERTLDIAKALGSRTISISGGEPTMHPDFVSFVEMALQRGFYVNLLTNGNLFRQDTSKQERIGMLSRNCISRLNIQVSSFKEYYEDYEEVHELYKDNISRYGLIGMSLADEDVTSIKLIALGRCADNPVLKEKAISDNLHCSCLKVPLYLVQGMGSFENPLTNLEMMGVLCKPMIAPNGDIRMSESLQCPPIANVSDKLEEIKDKIFSFRPCGACVNYKLHFCPPQNEKDRKIKEILG